MYVDEEKSDLEKQELVEKLLACESIKEQDLRDRITEKLRPEISDRIKKFGRGRYDVDSIVDTCLQYLWGIEELVYHIRYFEGNSRQLLVVENFVDRLHPKSVTLFQIYRLKWLLIEAKIPFDDLIDASINLYEKRGMPRPEWIASLQEKSDWGNELRFFLLNFLASVMKWGDEVPILMFAAEIVKYLENRGQSSEVTNGIEQDRELSVDSRIKAWIETTAAEQNLKIPPMKFLISSSTSSSLLYLLIKLDPNTDGQSFFIRAWLQNSQNENLGYSPVCDTPVKADVIPDIISKFLLESSKYMKRGDVYRLVIDFCLPREMLFNDVDHWLIQVSRNTISSRKRIGIRHPVIVRPIERFDYLPSFWEGKWNYFQSYASKKKDFQDTLPFVIFDIEVCNGQEDKIDGLLIPEHIVCLALTFVPQEVPFDILNAILSNGIPIVLWHRRHTHQPEELKRLFTSFLSENQLVDLPMLVWKVRLEGAGNDEHFGCHLTLLWDDPTRIPPDTKAAINEPFFEYPK